MTREEAFQKLYNFLFTELGAKRYHRDYFKIDGRKICKECTKHRVNPFYLRADPDLPLYLKCFRAGCNNNKLVEAKDLHSFGFVDDEAISLILKKSKKSTASYNNTKNSIIQEDLNVRKTQFDYILKRTKIALDDVSIKEYRFVINPANVINNLSNEYTNMMRTIKPENVVTFCSDNNNKFAIREINGKLKQLITIDPDKIGNYYTLSRGSTDKEIIFLCEGVFDCINMYNMNKNISNSLFIATFGFAGYESAIEYYYQKNLDTLKHIVLVMDSPIIAGENYYYETKDVDDLLKKLYRSLGKGFVEKISVVYNTKSKDFGDFRLPISPEIDIWYEGGKTWSY